MQLNCIVPRKMITWAICIAAWFDCVLALLNHLGCSIISTSDTYHRSQRYSVWFRGSYFALYMFPLWNFSGAWPLIPSTICNWRESSSARVLKLWPRQKKKRKLKTIHLLYWQWSKENKLEIFPRRGLRKS